MSIEVKITKSRGRGIFAMARFLEGSTLDEAPVIEFGEKASRLFIDEDDGEKVLSWRKDNGGSVVSTAVACSILMLANHDDDHNAFILRDFRRGMALLKACRTIEAGEEITIRYEARKTF